MKKILAFLSAFVFLGTSTLVVTACGVSNGQVVDINVPDAPELAEETQDPLIDYVYNNQYIYSNVNSAFVMTTAAQLTTDKIYENQSSFTGPIWTEFFNSEVWQRDYFSSFNYQLDEAKPAGEHDFSYQGANQEDFIFQVADNDLSEDKNKMRVYWFTTSPEAWSAGASGYQQTKNNITIPDLNEFDSEEVVTRTGWVHFYLLIPGFRIDFAAQINFDFMKLTDKNNQSAVLLSTDTFLRPFGEIDFNNAKDTYNRVINNVEISYYEPEEDQ